MSRKKSTSKSKSTKSRHKISSKTKDKNKHAFTVVVKIILLSLLGAVLLSSYYKLANRQAALTSKQNGALPTKRLPKTTDKQTDIIEINNFVAGEILTVDYLFLKVPGFVVVYEYENEIKGSIIGKSKLQKSGVSKKITIPLDRETEINETLVAEIYKDDGDGVCEVPGEDMVVTDQNGNLVKTILVIGGEGAVSPRI